MTAAPPLGLYIHLPWCVRKCPYCDFNSHEVRGELPTDDYLAALLRDLEREAPAAGGRTVETIFIGGGTPSLFPPASVAALLEAANRHLTLSPAAEITLEANPGTVEQARFEGYRRAGVNRLSIGIQSFNDEHLARLGRIHGRDEALTAARAASAAGFDNFNLDLMFALPGQSQEQALADIRQAIELAPSHISHYQLTLEPNTVFHAKPPILPDDDTAYAMQDDCQAELAAAGYRQYEVSAYARPGRECRHNLNYWTFGDYLALGAGAHGKLTDPRAGRIERYRKVRVPASYMAKAGDAEATAERWSLNAPDIVLEFMMNALRLNDGVPLELIPERTGLPSDAFAAMIEQGERRGWLATNGGRLRATETGQRYLNSLLEIFLPEAP